jgi:hypothetical protein
MPHKKSICGKRYKTVDRVGSGFGGISQSSRVYEVGDSLERGILGEKLLDFSPPPRLLLDLTWSLSSSSEVGGSSCGGDSVGAIFSPAAALFLFSFFSFFL